jgi:crotonobetainyl-CoA:carnitine CoA-transferase CaiB-like acyl-CoA transferase
VQAVLAADIAGGAYPAVINILLALRGRERTGAGCHLDISMSRNLSTLAYSALATWHGSGRWPVAGDGLLTGGSPWVQGVIATARLSGGCCEAVAVAVGCSSVLGSRQTRDVGR